mgnify:CR=1 FL=1
MGIDTYKEICMMNVAHDAPGLRAGVVELCEKAVAGCVLVPRGRFPHTIPSSRVSSQSAALLQLFSCAVRARQLMREQLSRHPRKQCANWQPGAVGLGRRYPHEQVKHVGSESATIRLPGRRMALESNIRGRSDEGLPISLILISF